jgi:hypothetical protein
MVGQEWSKRAAMPPEVISPPRRCNTTVEDAVLIPEACRGPGVLGYNGHFFLETGAAEDSYNQSMIILFSIT